jgi:hypothetical protein
MYSLTHALEVQASNVAVWRLLSDFEGAPAWKTDLVGEAGVLRKDVVEWDEGKWMRLELTDSSLPLARAKLMLGVEPIGAGRSTVVVEFEYEPLAGAAKCFGSRFALRGKLCRSVHRMLASFKSAAETTTSTEGVLRPVRA